MKSQRPPESRNAQVDTANRSGVTARNEIQALLVIVHRNQWRHHENEVRPVVHKIHHTK